MSSRGILNLPLPASSREPTISANRPSLYLTLNIKVVAEVRSIYANAPMTERACVIDFGLKVIGDPNALPAGCKSGDYVCGEMTFILTNGHAIPPEESVERLRRKWHVNAIQADLTPHIQHPEHRYFMRDESRIERSRKFIHRRLRGIPRNRRVRDKSRACA